MRPSINVPTDGSRVRWPGGSGTLTLGGSFNGASAQVNVAAPVGSTGVLGKKCADGTTQDHGASETPRAFGSAVTVAGAINLPALPVLDLSIVVTGGSSPAVTATAQPLTEF